MLVLNVCRFWNIISNQSMRMWVHVKDQVANQNSSTSQEKLPHDDANCRIAADGDWVREVKNEAGRWNGDKLVVLSLFDGIGGVWAALTRLGIPFLGYSSEVVSTPASAPSNPLTSIGSTTE